MATELVTAQSTDIERVLIQGDISKLTSEQKIQYYAQLCKSLGLNPLTKPFDYLSLQGKIVLYAKKDATDQLRMIHGVSVIDVNHTHNEGIGLYIVTAKGKTRDGREDTGTGAVNVKGLSGNDLANAIMKAETKAKRRLTLSICGLGMLDETEIETIKGAKSTQLRIAGVLEKYSLKDGGVAVASIGKDKFWVRDAGIDSTLASAEGKDVELEYWEAYGPKGKYNEVTKVIRIGRYDFSDSQDMTPQLDASVELINQERIDEAANSTTQNIPTIDFSEG